MQHPLSDDTTAAAYSKRQQDALAQMPSLLQSLPTYSVPLVSFNVTGVANVRRLFAEEHLIRMENDDHTNNQEYADLDKVLDDIVAKGQRVIFTMGKGGVGKTTVANAIALGLAERDLKVHLTTTDPAAQLEKLLQGNVGRITRSNIDPKIEVQKYRQEVLDKVRETMDEQSVAYAEEELNSPCTEEIAVFRAFADLVEKAEHEVVVIDTAPSGHTLLLLDATESYHKEIANSSGEVPLSVKKLLPRLRNQDETAVVIVTHAEITPVFEAERLSSDLQRAGIIPKWWVINQSLASSGTKDSILQQREASEQAWIQQVDQISEGNFVVIPWQRGEGRTELEQKGAH